MSKFIVTEDGLAAHSEHTGELLTWETRIGAQKFADMNGGVVTPFAVLDASVSTMDPYNTVPTKPDPLEGGTRQLTECLK